MQCTCIQSLFFCVDQNTIVYHIVKGILKDYNLATIVDFLRQSADGIGRFNQQLNQYTYISFHFILLPFYTGI